MRPAILSYRKPKQVPQQNSGHQWTSQPRSSTLLHLPICQTGNASVEPIFQQIESRELQILLYNIGISIWEPGFLSIHS